MLLFRSSGIIRTANRSHRHHTKILGKECHPMASGKLLRFFPVFFIFASTFALEAQMPPAKPNPLIPGQGAQGKAGCSTTEASSCTEAAAKILPIVMGAS